MATATNELLTTKVVPQSDWIAARKKLLAKEKEFTRLRDELSQARREMPWEKVENPYNFEGPKGKETLADLFDGRSQLVVYHFMLGPGWKEGCPSCSFLADSFDGAAVHVAQRDVTFLVVSRAPLAEIEAFKKRMGWRFKWVSSFGSNFNFDYQVSTKKDEQGKKTMYNYELTEFPSDERPGLSVFYRAEDGSVFHTYSTYARGLDILLTAYNIIDMTPKGRNEEGMKPHAMAWVRHHDRYGDATMHACCVEGSPKTAAILEPMLLEFREEAATTRRVLERIPADKLSWKPHARSMSLGQLAMHVAEGPGRIATMLQGNEFEVNTNNLLPSEAKNADQIKSTFEESTRAAENFLRTTSEQAALGNFLLKVNGKTGLNVPRVEIVRKIMLNHIYHHRGQLSVYLRMLEVPVPVIYGRSADEHPFA